MDKNILITGGMGFIGSHLVRHFVKKYKNYKIINLDALTYASNEMNLIDLGKGISNYKFIKGNILDLDLLNRVFDKYDIDNVIHLAAETHVDNSIKDPNNFVNTNVIGTINLLNVFLEFSKKNKSGGKFYQISTDEVYGSILEGKFFEDTPYSPRSPYSASKASADHFVRAYGETYGLDYIISNCSNNYGPNQSLEKFIPVVINSIINKDSIPIYGDGDYTRDWLFVIDHVEAVDIVFHRGKIGETYNVGGDNQWKNIDLVKFICDRADIKLSRAEGTSQKLISYVDDRLGHDKRYAIDCEKIKTQLNWNRRYKFKDSIDNTIDWYISNEKWRRMFKSYTLTQKQ